MQRILRRQPNHFQFRMYRMSQYDITLLVMPSS